MFKLLDSKRTPNLSMVVPEIAFKVSSGLEYIGPKVIEFINTKEIEWAPIVGAKVNQKQQARLFPVPQPAQALPFPLP